MRKSLLAALAVVHALALAGRADAQGAPPSYGEPISLDLAKKLAVAAQAEAAKIGVPGAVAVVEPTGSLVYFQKMDGTQYGSIAVAMDKATSSAKFRRTTKVLAEALGKGNTYLLTLTGANAVPGGMPIMVGGKIVGGIGCSGATGDQDVQICEAALAALK